MREKSLISRCPGGQTLMAGFALAAVLCAYCATPCEAASPQGARPTILVARFVLLETAPADQRYDVAADDRRIALVTSRARTIIARSGAYRVLDRGPKDAAPPYSYMSCHACIWDWAHSRGADYVLVGWVQKESRLILSVGMILLDAQRQTVVKATSTQIRDDTDRMWLAATDYLLKKDILSGAARSGVEVEKFAWRQEVGVFGR
jgi:hypothetical protein